MEKIIVVHPGKQHSYRLAEALKKNGMLQYYVTTVYDKKNSWTHILGKYLKGDNKKRFLTRKNEVFDNDVVQFCELPGLFLLLLYRKMPKSKFTKWFENHIHKVVYQKTIKFAGKNKPDAIIFYDGLSEKHFRLKEKYCPNTKFIIDVPSATDEYMRKILEEDIAVTGDEYTRIEQSETWHIKDSAIPARNRLADGFLVGSSFVRKSLTNFNTDERKIKIVPYGVDTSRFVCKHFTMNSGKIRFIFVGRVNRRKGIQHLLPAFDKIESNKAELVLVGPYDENDELVKKYATHSNIFFKGFVTSDVVADYYMRSDIFVLPSLGEGLAQVGIEAMNCGLPIIVSDNSGVNDLVTEGREGFVVPTSDMNALYEKMQWFVENPSKVKEMGVNAYATAKKYTWNFYETNVVRAIKEILSNQ